MIDYPKNTRNNRKENKKQHILETIHKDLDVRDRCLGIRELRSKYNPIPYHNKDKEGKQLSWTQGAQKAAEYLSQQQWGKPSQEGQDKKQSRQAHYQQHVVTVYDLVERYKTEPPTLEALIQLSKN